MSRIMQLASTNLDKPVPIAESEDMSEYFSILDKFEINKAAEYVWNRIAELDKEIQDRKPWETKDKEVITGLVTKLYSIARMLNPLLPDASTKIKALIKSNQKPGTPLFPRLNGSTSSP